MLRRRVNEVLSPSAEEVALASVKSEVPTSPSKQSPRVRRFGDVPVVLHSHDPLVRATRIFILVAAVIVCFCHYFQESSYTEKSAVPIWSQTMHALRAPSVNQYHNPFTITFRRSSSQPFAFPSDIQYESSDLEEDYGGLNFEDLEPESFRRRISDNDFQTYELERRKFLRDMSKHHVSSYYTPSEELTYPRQCEPPAWKSAIFPVCNIVHEITLVAGTVIKYLG
jgi:hypothetical protein